MQEIIEYILDKMRDDSVLPTMLGSSEADDRIYGWNPPFDILYSDSEKAAIFYKESQDPRGNEFSFPSQKGNIKFILQVVSPDKTLVIEIYDYLDTLFCDPYSNSFETDNWRVLVTKNDGYSSGEIGNPGKILHVGNFFLSLEEIFKR